MTRWNWKRWAFAIVTGSALAGSFSTLASDDMPRAGETITLKYPGQPDRVVTVMKSTRKPDGSLETEVRDGKSGDTFVLVDPAPENKIPSVVPAKAVPVANNPIPPLPKPLPSVATTKPVAPPAPLPPLPTVVSKPTTPSRPAPMSSFADVPGGRSPVAGQTPMPPPVDPRDKRKLLNREPEGPVTVPSASVASDDSKRPGIIGRVFGKKPTPPAMPATSLPVPAPVTAAPTIRPNAEPPRVQPAKPVAPVTPPVAPNRVDRVLPPTPVVPPISAPSAPDASPVPLPSKPVPPVAAPSFPTPRPVESIPVPPPPAKPTLPPQPIPVPTIPSTPTPTIPSIPMTSVPVQPAVEVKPAAVPEVVKPVANVSPVSLEALSATLKDAPAPSARLKAVKELATGSHASTDAAKNVLFYTAKTDPCAAVKADCIEHLAKLGYRDTAFVQFVKDSCADESGEVRLAAKSAMEKLAK